MQGGEKNKKHLDELKASKNEKYKHNENVLKIWGEEATKKREKNQKRDENYKQFLTQRMEKEPYQKIDEITTKVNTYVEKLEGTLGQIEKTLHSPIKLTDNKTSSIQQLDDNIKELESLEKDIQKDSKKVDKLNKACQIKEKKINSINRSPFKRVISLFTGEKNKLKRELKEEKRELDSVKSSLSQLNASKEQLTNEVTQALPALKTHCENISNRYQAIYPTIRHELATLSKEHDFVVGKTPNTQQLYTEKDEQLRKAGKDLSLMEEKTVNMKYDLIEKVEKYQDIEFGGATKNKQKPLIDLSVNAQSISNKEKVKKLNKDKEMTSPALKKMRKSTEIEV
ncbi:hypothetical protein AALA44_09525 [Enterococcus ratti]|uniref:hypothetical protein n=1 Tax=Enterococcus ratti TaxID=150033 RepID=UPI003515A33D